MSTQKERICFQIANHEDALKGLSLAKSYIRELARWTSFDFSFSKLSSNIVEAIDDPNQLIVAAYYQGDLIGFIWCYVWSPVWTYDGVCSDIVMYVSPEHRGMNTGKGLIELMLRWAELKEAKYVQVGANSGIHNDMPARTLYKSKGFKESGYTLYKEVT